MNNLNIISIIILFIIIVSLIIFFFKYVSQFYFHKFMDELQEKLRSKEKKEEIDEKTKDAIIYAFEKLFNRYYDNAGVGFLVTSSACFFVNFFTVIPMLISVILQYYNKCKKCKFFFIIILPICSLAIMFFNFRFAFESKNKVNLSEKDIYIYDDEFNKEIKNNIDFMYKRKL